MPTPSAPNVYRLPLASDQTLEFTWGPPADDGGTPITGYRLTFIPRGGSPFYRYPSANLIYWKETGLVNGTWYEVFLEASNDGGSTYGDIAPFLEFQPGNKPAYPALTATAVTFGLTSALVSWTPPPVLPDAEINWYSIYAISNNPSDPIIKGGADGLVESSTVLEGLNPNSTYLFEVYAVNCPGYSPEKETNTIQWFNSGTTKLATRIGGAATYSYSTLATDASGNVYIRYRTTDTTVNTIYNYSSAPVGSGAVGTSVYGTVSGFTSYLVKYNSSGVAQWAVPVPSAFDTFTDRVSDIVCDASNNIYVVGNAANQTLTLYNYSSAPVGGGAVGITAYGTLPLPSANQYYPSAYIIKYDTSGSVLWATRTLVNASFAHEIQHVTVTTDINNNVYTAFYVTTGGATSITLYNYTSAPPNNTSPVGTTIYGTYSAGGSAGYYNTLITKYNSSGTIQSVSALEPTITDNNWVGLGLSLKTDSLGNLYVHAGRVTNTTVTVKNYSSAPVGGGAVGLSTYGTMTVSGNGTIIVKFNSSGSAQWATKMNVSGTQTSRRPYLGIDSSDNVYAFGTITASSGNPLTLFSFSSQPAGGGAIGTTSYGTIAAQAYATTYIVKYNSAGVIQWATAIRGNENNVNRSVCDSAGNSYVIVYGSSSVTPMNYSSPPSPVNTGPVGLVTYGTITYAGGSGNDVYLIKYNTSGSVVWATRLAGTLSDTSGGVDVYGSDVYITGIYASNPLTINDYSTAPVAQGNVGLTTFGTLPDVNVGAGNNIFLVKYTA